MTLTIVKFCAVNGLIFKQFDLYFRPKQKDPPDYSPGHTFSRIATDAGAALLSLPREWQAWTWNFCTPPFGPDVCAMWLAAVSDLAITGGYPTLQANRWTWAGKELIDVHLMHYHPALMDNIGTEEGYIPKAFPYRFGAFLDDIYWKSAEACRIIRAFLSSSLTVAEIRLLRSIAGAGFPHSVPRGEQPTKSGEDQANTEQRLIGRLKDMGLVESMQGRRNLVWATPKGCSVAFGLFD